MLVSATASPSSAQQGEAGEWRAGAYSFSDEMGGFIIESVTGRGTRDNPIVLTETLNSSSPVTLVIRSVWPIRPFDSAAFYDNGILYMRIVARNGSGHGWVEFEFELQELLHKASVFGDGLSFDQRSLRKDNISSDTFAEFSRDFEPYDKLLFRHGKVDPGKSVGFSFLITDFTPRPTFYLVQDPRIPST
ncbi:hypothetical protein RB623_22945 [Mesorhizobium sp. LHD-90]|uniref:hypothetical protein n=1 Tax=Mesorhizobium sp. LHD-90 TaxID=3071414 RepID=UPI0027DF5D4A|nr:hypothetical protein [Mesorhizobium sp. LHD-90]MDQ6436918.1 hypothetical protein [Mesorhizobium sp. LHD-90]